MCRPVTDHLQANLLKRQSLCPHNHHNQVTGSPHLGLCPPGGKELQYFVFRVLLCGSDMMLRTPVILRSATADGLYNPVQRCTPIISLGSHKAVPILTLFRGMMMYPSFPALFLALNRVGPFNEDPSRSNPTFAYSLVGVHLSVEHSSPWSRGLGKCSLCLCRFMRFMTEPV